MAKRVFLVVLDSFGVGEEPDAASFGDYGVNTLRSIAQSSSFNCPNLRALGLFNLDGIDFLPSFPKPLGAFGRLRERSMGRDTTCLLYTSFLSANRYLCHGSYTSLCQQRKNRRRFLKRDRQPAVNRKPITQCNCSIRHLWYTYEMLV